MINMTGNTPQSYQVRCETNNSSEITHNVIILDLIIMCMYTVSRKELF